jgi:hypothetical protein
MLEYAALTSSDPADLARQMTERSAQGWEILHIVSSGATITAFARRAAIAASAPATASTGAFTTQASTAPVTQASTPQPVQTSSWASTGTASTGTASTGTAPTASTPAATASSVGDAAAPAAWYPDPAGRFELRYWNGSAWTEHVSRNGQQSTDAPVA